jgi:hypothetical protein
VADLLRAEGADRRRGEEDRHAREESGELKLSPAGTGRANAGLRTTIPALPVRDVGAAVEHYSARFGFEAAHATEDFAVVARDGAVIHLWSASDEEWRSRERLRERPVCSGAESFLAGTASCRIEVGDVDGLFDELRAADVLHDVSREGVTATDFGTREFATVDLDGNLLTFFRWERS